MYVVLAILAIRFVGPNTDGVKCSIAIAPHLEALYCSDTFHLAKAVGTRVYICPDYVDVIKVDQISSSKITLEGSGPFDCCELIPDLNILVVNAYAFIVGVADAVRLGEGKITLHIGRIMPLAMFGVKGVRMYVGRYVGWY